MFSRRTLTKGMALTSLASLTSRLSAAFDLAQDYEGDAGVTSGSPMADGFTLWTRVPKAFRRGERIEVSFEVALDPAFEAKSVVSRGSVVTDSETDFTVKAKIIDLASNRFYFYRFKTETGYESVVGRARTAPEPGADIRKLTIAAVSCQSFSAGYYAAFAHLAKEEVDFAIHLGDHIYEADSGRKGSPDPLAGRVARTLDDYRKKYRYYLSDPAWREARRQFTWIDLWDDHEVFNNYAQADLEKDPTRFTGAYRAFAEYMPSTREVSVDAQGKPKFQMYQTYNLGSLLELYVLDQRQYRDSMPCNDDFGVPACAAARDAAHTMLGKGQKAWLKDSLKSSRAKWRVLLSEVMLSPYFVPSEGIEWHEGSHLPERPKDKARGDGAGKDAEADGPTVLNLDAWDGFPAERAELLDFIGREGIDNVVVVTGDIHSAYDSVIHRDPHDAESEAVAVEVVGAAISSWPLGRSLKRAMGDAAESIVAKLNPHFDWFDVNNNGYTLLTFAEDAMTVTHVAVDSVQDPKSSVKAVHQARVLTGSPHFVK